MNQRHQSFGDHVRAEREKAGLSIRALAGKAGISFAYLSTLEKGQYRGSAELAAKLATALDIDPQPLLTYFDVHASLPEPRAYFRRKLGVDANEADVLAQLIEDYQAKKNNEGGGNHEETDEHRDEGTAK